MKEASKGPVPPAFEFPGILFYIAFAFLSAAICTQINIRIGITPNTSVIGVIAAMVIGRTLLPYFRDIERQNMLQTAMSAGGFAAANIALVTAAILYLLDLRQLILPGLIGVAMGMAVDLFLAYRLFGTKAFPASAPWPDGIAIGQVIRSGDEGGEKGRRLLQGIAVGIAGRLFSLPMAGIGIAFIGNPISLGALGVAFIVRGYGSAWFEGSYIPHGFMIGAGLVQVVQTIRLISGRASGIRLREFRIHVLGFLVGAIALALLGGFDVSLPKLLTWLAFATIAAFVHTLIVGYCAMLTGWFPSFAVAIALMLVALLFGFPLPMLALLAGYILSSGPLFADLGYDLKSGWIVRDYGKDPEREAAGRYQQFLLQEVGGFVGIVFVASVFEIYFRAGLIPPMGKVLAATLGLNMSPAVLSQLALAAIPGVLLQWIGGPSRSLGVLFATGLLIVNPIYGIGLLAAVAIRLWFGDRFMDIRAPGLIAGDGLASFVDALWRM